MQTFISFEEYGSRAKVYSATGAILYLAYLRCVTSTFYHPNWPRSLRSFHFLHLWALIRPIADWNDLEELVAQLPFNSYLSAYQVSSCSKNYLTRWAPSLRSGVVRRPISSRSIFEWLALRLSKLCLSIVFLVSWMDLEALHIRALVFAG